MIKNFPTSSAPHLRVQDSASRITWKSAAALVPVCGVLLAHHPFAALRNFGSVLTCVLLLEILIRFIGKKKHNLQNGTAVLGAILLMLVIPSAAGLGMLFCASVLMVLGAAFYGGRASAWVHPSWLAYAFLAPSLPEALFSGTWQFAFWNPLTGFWAGLITLALLSGGIFLMIKKNSIWEVPLLYLGLVIVPWQLMGIALPLSFPLILLNAFWVLPDPGTAPCSRPAKIYGSIAAAFLTLGLGGLSIPAAPVFAVLMLNLLTPWMDEWILPRGISFEARVQGGENRP